MSWKFPKIYPILDAGVIPVLKREQFLLRLASELGEAGVTLLEYRNKTGPVTQIIADAAILRAAMVGPDIKLILDDRAGLVDQIGFDGVHVDAGDVPSTQARQMIYPEKMVGTFGGSDALLSGVLNEPADYWSIGPVFPTTTKETAKTPIGVAGVRKLRAEAGPAPVLVGAAGITLETAAAVLEAGASSVAVAAAIFRTADPAAEFGRWKAALG